MKKRILALFRLRNRHLLIADVFLLLFAPAIALYLRTESFDLPTSEAFQLAIFVVVDTVFKLAVFFAVGLYAQYWRYASVEELVVLLKAMAYTFVAEVAIFFGIMTPIGIIPAGFPRSVPVIDGVLAMLMVGGVRLSVRLIFSYDKRQHAGVQLKPALIVGAGVAGTMIVKELQTNKQLGLRPVGFIDDDPEKRGKRIHGIPVLGALADLPDVFKKRHISEVIIAMPTAPGRVIRDVVQSCRASGVVSQTMPGLFEILRGTARVDQIRKVQLEDLLRRGTVRTDTARVGELLRNARVMVTGAGGSIGSELCRQITDFGPSEIILVGHGENSIFQIAKELEEHPRPGMAIRRVIADIRDRDRMLHVFETYLPQVVFHAAAHKHVGLMESNVPESVTNNVAGTRVLLDLSERCGVDRFVMISSDKAVNPTSVMGVTKRVAELLVGEAARHSGRPFVSVRFGNVLGSRGSVVPVFKRQIEYGGPITISHPDVRRYFMTIPEAVQLVLQAGTMGYGGEVFVLDMGEQIKVIDLARDLIRLSGLEEGHDIDILVTGLGAGEKMAEELYFKDERVERTEHDKILVCYGNRTNGSAQGLPVRHKADEHSEKLRIDIETLIEAANQGSNHVIERIFIRLVPEYRSQTKGSDQGAVPEVSPTNVRGLPMDRATVNQENAIHGRSRAR
jgi:FlaA1/EpsC-like NDP-sugar epimerase